MHLGLAAAAARKFSSLNQHPERTHDENNDVRGCWACGGAVLAFTALLRLLNYTFADATADNQIMGHTIYMMSGDRVVVQCPTAIVALVLLPFCRFFSQRISFNKIYEH